MTTISNAFRNAGNIVQGENGENKLKTSGNPFVDVFTNATRGTSKEELDGMVDSLISFSVNHGSSVEEIGEMIKDIFVLMFHKRQTRGDGEGERELFYNFMISLYRHYPQTICDIIKSDLIAFYGYYKDYFLIWNKIWTDVESHNPKGNGITFYVNKYDQFIQAIVEVILRKRREDLKTLHKFFASHRKPLGNDIKMSVEAISQFIDGLREAGEPVPELSLLAKWIPKEGRALAKNTCWYVETSLGVYKKHNVVQYLVRKSLKMRNTTTGQLMDYPVERDIPFGALKKYRRENASLCATLDVTQQKMCGNRFAQIEPSRVASLCMSRNSAGLLNEIRKKPPAPHEEETGNRHPNKDDRVALRKKIREHVTNPENMNVGQETPTKIAYGADQARSTAEKEFRVAQWNAYVMKLRDDLRANREKMIEELRENGSMNDQIQRAILSGNILGCADMSGSMTWDNQPPNRPYDHAMALTAMISEVSNENWRDLAMAFSDNPRIFNFKTDHGHSMNIIERIREIKSHEGYTTNIEGMFREIIYRIKSSGARKDEMDDLLPVIVIFTDGEWNEQIKSQEDSYLTGHQKNEKMFAAEGFTRMPTIVYWNLKSNRNGVQTSQHHPGVQFLQGQSPALFKYILYGESHEMTEKEVVVDGETVTMKTSSVTPYDTFRKAMDQDYYEPLLMKVLSNSNEKELKHYTYIINVD